MPALDALRSHPNGYIPVAFEFEKQQKWRDLESVTTLAALARFVIANLTDGDYGAEQIDDHHGKRADRPHLPTD